MVQLFSLALPKEEVEEEWEDPLVEAGCLGLTWMQAVVQVGGGGGR